MIIVLIALWLSLLLNECGNGRMLHREKTLSGKTLNIKDKQYISDTQKSFFFFLIFALKIHKYLYLNFCCNIYTQTIEFAFTNCVFVY